LRASTAEAPMARIEIGIADFQILEEAHVHQQPGAGAGYIRRPRACAVHGKAQRSPAGVVL